jgi:cytochrome c-type biogenesis protein CcmH/NrfG
MAAEASTGKGQRPDADRGADPGVDPGIDTDELSVLEAERDDLLAMVERTRADAEAGVLDADDAEALVDDYTARADEVLTRIDVLRSRRGAVGSGTRTAKASGSQGTAGAGGSRGRTLAWVAGVVLFALVAGVFVAQSAGRRSPGDTFTGDIRQTTRELLLVARDQVATGEVDEALATYDEVLALAPTNAEALTYTAWVGRTMAGTLDDATALDLLDDALASEPDFADARVFTALILRDQGRFDAAAAQLVLLDDDDIPPFMRAQVENLRAEVGGGDPDRAAVARAEVLARQGSFAEAVVLLDEVLDRSPGDLGALVTKAAVLTSVAQATTDTADRDLLLANAAALLARAGEVAPRDPEVLLYQAAVAEVAGRTADALAALDALDALPSGVDVPPLVRAEAAAARARLGG